MLNNSLQVSYASSNIGNLQGRLCARELGAYSVHGRQVDICTWHVSISVQSWRNSGTCPIKVLSDLRKISESLCACEVGVAFQGRRCVSRCQGGYCAWQVSISVQDWGDYETCLIDVVDLRLCPERLCSDLQPSGVCEHSCPALPSSSC